MTIHHVLIRDFTRAITRDAASGSSAVSTCAAAALHFRAAVSQDAGARATTASHILCVTLIKPSCPDWHAPEDFFHLATAGLIRACIGSSDGTSNLVLQGLQRVRFTSFEPENPFPIASIDAVESRDPTTVETEALGAKVIELYGSLKHDRRQLPPKLDRYLSELRDLEMLADLMASTFVNDPLRRQRLLEERSLNQRLRFLIRYLREEIGNAAA
jgi:ATP-dependent Lon protease